MAKHEFIKHVYQEFQTYKDKDKIGMECPSLVAAIWEIS
ncbi:MAG: hypothetical protein Pg6B_09270 [Candidatus Azobacteroides pseudotrichonymphae]|jgi:hypothetical protein|nr:MAG: hypothetical protein Pg6B_09270 [Candidatus Azobacteroides pseudotrichonymphae]